MDKILKYDDLLKISNLLIENGCNYDNITVEIGIHTQKMIDRINDDFFYRTGAKNEAKVNDVSEINITLNDVKFRYICDEKK